MEDHAEYVVFAPVVIEEWKRTGEIVISGLSLSPDMIGEEVITVLNDTTVLISCKIKDYGVIAMKVERPLWDYSPLEEI